MRVKQAKSLEVLHGLDGIREDLLQGTTREKTAESLFELADRVAYGDPEGQVSEDEEPDPEDVAVAWLNENATPVTQKGKTYWWFKPHNLMLNRALFAWNLWHFTSTPVFRKTTVVRDRETQEPKGLLLRLSWVPASNHDFRSMNLELAKKIHSLASQQKAIPQSISKEVMAAAEKDGGVDVGKILGRLLPQVEKIALRRIGMKGEAPLEIWPIDGGKPEKF
jgi:hypothetical protein